MGLEELLAPRSRYDDHTRRPPSHIAKQAVDAAWERHARDNPAVQPGEAQEFFVATRHGRKWAHCWNPRYSVPVLTHGNSEGPWVAARGRRLTPGEYARFQSINAPKWSWPPGASIGALAGNTMSVRLVARIVRHMAARATGDAIMPDPVSRNIFQRELRAAAAADKTPATMNIAEALERSISAVESRTLA